MKVWVATDHGDGEISVHSKREEAEAEATRRAGGSGTWADAPSEGWRKITGSSRTVRVAERSVGGDPLGE